MQGIEYKKDCNRFCDYRGNVENGDF